MNNLDRNGKLLSVSCVTFFLGQETKRKAL